VRDDFDNLRVRVPGTLDVVDIELSDMPPLARQLPGEAQRRIDNDVVDAPFRLAVISTSSSSPALPVR